MESINERKDLNEQKLMLNRKVYILDEDTRDDDTLLYADIISVYIKPFDKTDIA